jgi:hypothetical protein
MEQEFSKLSNTRNFELTGKRKNVKGLFFARTMTKTTTIQTLPMVVCTDSGGNTETSFLGEGQTPHFTQRLDAAHLNEMIRFTKTILEDSDAAPSIKDGRAALNIGLAASKSTNIKKPIRVAM